MSALPKMSERVADALKGEQVLDELKKARLERQFLAAALATTPSLHSVPAAAAPSKTNRRALVAAGAGALALAAIVMLVLRVGLGTGESAEAPRYAIRFAGAAEGTGSSGASAGPVGAGTELVLAAGESADVALFDLSVSVRDRSRFRVEAVSLADVRVALDGTGPEGGEARFAFHPRDRGNQHVAISTPAARIEIVGTELTVRASEASTDVTVHEGVVRVVPMDGGEAVLVRAGSSVSVPRVVSAETSGTAEVGALAAASLGVAADGVGEVADIVPTEPSAGTAGGGVSLSVAEDPAELEGPSIAERLARAETLDDQAAERLLEAIIADAEASRAQRATAWTQLGDLRRASPERALEAFRHAEALGRGADRANAIYEQARLYDRALHDEASARTEYARYLTEFPAGPNAASVRTRICALGGADGVACD